MKITYKCAHCGFVFPATRLTADCKPPAHLFNKQPCPGALEKPRNTKDIRPLLKDVSEKPLTA
jgi:hypothetical protein